MSKVTQLSKYVNSKLYKSALPNFDDLHSFGEYKMMNAYSRAKLYNIYMTLAWKRHLPKSRIELVALHPGYVNTNLARSITGNKRILF